MDNEGEHHQAEITSDSGKAHNHLPSQQCHYIVANNNKSLLQNDPCHDGGKLFHIKGKYIHKTFIFLQHAGSTSM